MVGPDYILDLSSQRRRNPAPEPANQNAAPTLRNRPWLAVHFKCCQVYTRIYRNAAGTAYEGRCPRCGSPVNASVGPGGTRNRFFTAE